MPVPVPLSVLSTALDTAVAVRSIILRWRRREAVQVAPVVPVGAVRPYPENDAQGLSRARKFLKKVVSERTFDTMVVMQPDELDTLIATLRSVDLAPPADLPDAVIADQLVAIGGVVERMRSMYLDTLAAFDAKKIWTDDGATCASAWVAERLGQSRAIAGSDLRLATKLAAMPAVAEALSSGAIGTEAAALLRRVRNDRTADAFARDEELLVGFAGKLTVDQLAVGLREWKARADPDGCEPSEGHDRNEVHLSRTLDGRFRLNGDLDAEAGGIFSTVLDQITDELFHTEDPASRAATPPARRRADGLVEMARRAGAVDPEDAKQPKPAVTVVVDWEDLVDPAGSLIVLPTGGHVHAETIRRLACDANISRVVMNGRSEVLDVGRSTRTPTAAQARAVLARDKGCAVGPRRSIPLHRCEASEARASRFTAAPSGRGAAVTRSTTSSTGPTTGRPASKTSPWSAGDTTAPCTRAASSCGEDPTANSTCTGQHTRPQPEPPQPDSTPGHPAGVESRPRFLMGPRAPGLHRTDRPRHLAAGTVGPACRDAARADRRPVDSIAASRVERHDGSAAH